jgi:membrane protein required for colicin V production
MNTLDLFILIPMLWGGHSGYKAGFLMTVLSLLSFFVAIVLGFKFYLVVLTILKPMLDLSNSIAPYVAFLATFFAVFFLVNRLARYLKTTLDSTVLGSFDSLIGAVVGAIKFAFFVSLFLMIFHKVGNNLSPVSPELTKGSLLYPAVEPVAPYVIKNLSKIMQFGEDVVKEAKDIINSDKVPAKPTKAS